MDKDIDKTLERRATPQAPSNLSERIILESLKIRSRRRFELSDAVKVFFALRDFVVLPRPALAFAAALLLGAGFGYVLQSNYENVTFDMSYLAIADNFDYEEWL